MGNPIVSHYQCISNLARWAVLLLLDAFIQAVLGHVVALELFILATKHKLSRARAISLTSVFSMPSCLVHLCCISHDPFGVNPGGGFV